MCTPPYLRGLVVVRGTQPTCKWNGNRSVFLRKGSNLGGRLMYTNKCAQPEGHFQRLGGVLSNHPNQNQKTTNYQTRVYPYPLGAGSARPNPKMGAPAPENPLFLGFFVLRGGLRPWSQTMVWEGARPWGRGRSGDCELLSAPKLLLN